MSFSAIVLKTGRRKASGLEIRCSGNNFGEAGDRCVHNIKVEVIWVRGILQEKYDAPPVLARSGVEVSDRRGTTPADVDILPN
jgi:hypothetical protein